MSTRFHAAMVLILTLVSTHVAGRSVEGPVDRAAPAKLLPIPAKTGTFSGKLLLPLFVVDPNTPDGPTTFFAIRNESNAAVEISVRYFARDTPYDPSMPGPTLIPPATLNLGPKEIHAVDVRSQNIPPDPGSDNMDGLALGYIIFETVSGEAAIQGDYFQINDGQNFASGFRLVNIDPNSNANDLCSRFSMRFIDSALLFDSGTVLTIWLQPDLPFDGLAFSYSAFSTAGGDSVLDLTFPSARFAFEIAAADLLFGVDEDFGAIEFEFPPNTVGHISAVMSAFGRLSVGFEATCLDPT